MSNNLKQQVANIDFSSNIVPSSNNSREHSVPSQFKQRSNGVTGSIYKGLTAQLVAKPGTSNSGKTGQDRKPPMQNQTLPLVGQHNLNQRSNFGNTIGTDHARHMAMMSQSSDQRNLNINAEAILDSMHKKKEMLLREATNKLLNDQKTLAMNSSKLAGIQNSVELQLNKQFSNESQREANATGGSHHFDYDQQHFNNENFKSRKPSGFEKKQREVQPICGSKQCEEEDFYNEEVAEQQSQKQKTRSANQQNNSLAQLKQTGNLLPSLNIGANQTQFGQITPAIANGLITEDSTGLPLDSYKNFRTHSLLVSVLQEKQNCQNARKSKPQKFLKNQSQIQNISLQNVQSQQVQNQQIIQGEKQKSISSSLRRYSPRHALEDQKIQLTGQRITMANQNFPQQQHDYQYLSQQDRVGIKGKPPLMPPIANFNTQTCLSPPQQQNSLKTTGYNSLSQQQFDQIPTKKFQNYIYDFMFVQVTSAVFERDLASKIKFEQSTVVQDDATNMAFSDKKNALQKIDQISKQTQHTNLKVIWEADLMQQQQESDSCQTEFRIDDLLNKVTVQLNQLGKRSKITLKKNYVSDLLQFQKGSQNYAEKMFLIVSDNCSLALNSAKKMRQLRKTNTVEAEVQSQRNLDQLQNTDDETINDYQPEEAKRTPITLGAQKLINTNNQRGYESDHEKSIDSSTTSSSMILQINLKMRKNTLNILQIEKSQTPKQQVKKLALKKNDDSSLRKSILSNDENSNNQFKINQAEPQIEKKNAYPVTKIKLWHIWEPKEQIANHPIQQLFENYNEFVKIVFVNKASYEQNYNKQRLSQLIKISKKIGLTLLKGQLLPSNLKSRENSNMLKERILQCWCKIISSSNTFNTNFPPIFNKKLNENTKQIQESEQTTLAQINQVQSNDKNTQQVQYHYKGFVGRGNNGQLVKSLFKCRYWWFLHDKEEMDKVNFMWTQCRKQEIMKQLRTKLILNTKESQNSNQTGKRKRNLSAVNFILGSSADRNKENQQEQQKQQTEQPLQIKTDQYPVKIYNKIEDNYHLSNKKALFLNMRFYYEALGMDPFYALPMTFHVKSGLEDPEFLRFKSQYESLKGDKSNVWIIKPGENTNRGQGISVLKDFSEIQNLIEESTRSKKRTCIVQKYICNPLLINRRKFDIRSYALVTSINGNMKGYFYDEGYLRTSCREFSINNLSNKLVHLTNDAIQKYAADYGKFESGNKLSYIDFQNYLDKNFSHLNICVERDLVPQLKKLTCDCMKAVWGKMDPFKRINTFEVFGLDFMFDDEFKPYLIEVNTNPCLELSSPLLARLIPNMLENSFRIVADPMFPPPEGFSQKKQVVQELCPENKFHLVFDEEVDGADLVKLFKTKENIIVEIDEDEISDEEVNDE